MSFFRRRAVLSCSLFLLQMTDSLCLSAAAPAILPAPADPGVVQALAEKLAAAPDDAARDALLAAAPATLTDSRELRRAFRGIYTKFFVSGDYAREEPLIRYDRRLSEQLGDAIGVAIADQNQASIQAQRGENARGLALFEQCRKTFAAAGDKKHLAGVMMNIGITQIQLADFRHALENVRGAHDLFIELGDENATISSLESLGDIEMDEGLPDRAMDFLQQALKLASGDASWEAYLFHNIAGTYEIRGDLQQAITYMERSVTLAEKTGQRWS